MLNHHTSRPSNLPQEIWPLLDPMWVFIPPSECLSMLHLLVTSLTVFTLFHIALYLLAYVFLIFPDLKVSFLCAGKRKWLLLSFPTLSGRWLSSKEPSCNAGDTSSVSGCGRSPEVGNCNALQYSCLENSTDKGVWLDTDPGVAKSRTWLSMYAPCLEILLR